MRVIKLFGDKFSFMPIFISILDRKGLRLFLCFLFGMISKIKYGIFIKISYDFQDKLWAHFTNGKLIYVDYKPNWNANYSVLQNLVNDLGFQYFSPPVEGGLIIDIGAANGTETIVYSNIVGERGKVYAIEAHPKTFKALKKLSSHYSNINPVQCAITDFSGKVYITSEVNSYHNTVVNIKSGIEITTISIDEFIESNKIDKINLMKINIEGSEEKIFNTIDKALSLTDCFAISCHDFLFNSGNVIRGKIIKKLKDHNFQIFENKTGNIVKDSWIFAKINS